MNTDKNTIMHEIASAYSFSDKEAQTACLLLEARAELLDFTFHQYIQRYHPDGFLTDIDSLPEPLQGYEQFIKDDALTVLHLFNEENKAQFIQFCSHIFSKQQIGILHSISEQTNNSKWENFLNTVSQGMEIINV